MSTRTQWEMTIKPALLSDVCKLPYKELQQVMEKIRMLSHDPRPDGKVKKQLTHVPGRPYRIRSGKYRIFYTFNQRVVSIYKLDERGDDTYNDTAAPDSPLAPEALADLDVPEDLNQQETYTPADYQSHSGPQGYQVDSAAEASARSDGKQPLDQSTCRKFPEPITVEILNQLEVPDFHHARLLRVQDEDELLACPGVDDEFLLKIHRYMFERPLEHVMQEPDLVLNDVDDLLRFKDGELLSFLLKLSPEQERTANWSLRVMGPTLVKGGPGTGKSMVALYRIRSLLTQLMQDGLSPRLLFTTYTNALIKSSRQLLQQLLGPNASYVRVDTADTIARSILQEQGQENAYQIITPEDLHKLTTSAIATITFTGSQLQQQAQRKTLQRMSRDYLEEELNSVIVARRLQTLEEYQQASRTGRKMSLNATQRTAVWLVYERWRQLLQEQGKETWQQRRVRAAALASSSSLAHTFDGVVIDEAQDLDPSAIRLLITLCKSPNRLLITADANQSIYGSGFSWSEVNESLKFPGRTSVLRANYRSTAEIGEATRSYLLKDALEPQEGERTYVNNGPLPVVRTVLNAQSEIQLLVSFFKKASRSLCHTMGSCAVLCPSESAGRALEKGLRQQGLEATFMTGKDLNLVQPGIKIITLKSSKGLEFPIVALAGFTPQNYPIIAHDVAPEAQDEILARERRTLFVAMTRAMRALLIIVPFGVTTPLLRDFDPNLWNVDRPL